MEAALAGDTARWHRYVSDSALWTGPGLQTVRTPVVLPIIAANTTLRPGQQTIRDLQVFVFGSTALATYVQLVAGPTGGERAGKRFRKTDTFLRRDTSWVLIGATEVAVPFRPTVTLSEARRTALSGWYVLPGVDSLEIRPVPGGFRMTSRDGSTLELLSANDSTLFEEGDPGEWIIRPSTPTRAGVLIYRMQGGADVVLQKVTE